MSRIKPSDLLGRREAILDTPQIFRAIQGKVILITGAGGTIGGELSRQVVQYQPEKVILLDNHATSLVAIESKIRQIASKARIVSVLGDVRNQDFLNKVFTTHSPKIVFHAAAHKHLVQLESNVQEGVSNNLVGTYYLAETSKQHNVELFLLVSTDKAVNPTCVMGATKRACELLMETFSKDSKTIFTSVRFGNVLGSSGSVLPIFQEQVENNQPLTVTHSEATRFFMTVEEAVGLILQATTMAKGGEVFLLKMGGPVRILDLAYNLLRMSNKLNLPVYFTGLKSGEKLHEQLHEDSEYPLQSFHQDIVYIPSSGRTISDLPEQMLHLELLTRGTYSEALVKSLALIVPSFVTSSI